MAFAAVIDNFVSLLTAEAQNLKVRESKFLDRLSSTDVRARVASTAAKESLGGGQHWGKR